MLKIKAQLKIKRPCVCNSKRKCICGCVGLVGGCVGEGSERAAKEKQKKGRGRLLVETKKKEKKTDGGNREIIKTPATAILECPSRHSPTVAIPPLAAAAHPQTTKRMTNKTKQKAKRNSRRAPH